MALLLGEVDAVSFQNLFVDGTKIEAVAGKYTFVWKKGVAKNRAKLMEKLDTFLAGVEKVFLVLYFLYRENTSDWKE